MTQTNAADPFGDLFVEDADWAQPAADPSGDAGAPSLPPPPGADASPPPETGPDTPGTALADLFSLDEDGAGTPPTASLARVEEPRRSGTHLAAVEPDVDGADLGVEVVASGPERSGPAEGATNVSRVRAAIDEAVAADAVDQRRADAARAVTVADFWKAHRWHEGAALMPYVTRILGVIGADQTLQARLNDMALTRDASVDAANLELFSKLIRDALAGKDLTLTNPRDIPYVLEMAYDEWIGISVLGPLWRDDDVTEIMVDSWDRVIVERDGQLIVTPAKFEDHNHAMSVARNLSEKISDRAVNNSSPIVNAELPGARVNFAVGSIVKSGLSISMRKFRQLLGMDGLLRFEALDETMLAFLVDCVAARANILVSGGTGTGKTTFINALSEYIPEGERVITIEDVFELSLTNAMVVAMQSREPTRADAKTAINQSDLLVNALRMRPDRIIVGEIREGRGAQVMLQAANTGHDGTMTTVHANDPVMALDSRFPDMLGSVTAMPADVARRQVASALDVVVQVTRRGKRRYVSSIVEVDRRDAAGGSLEPHVLFEGQIDDGVPSYRQVGSLRSDTDLAAKLADAGVNLDRWKLSGEVSA